MKKITFYGLTTASLFIFIILLLAVLFHANWLSPFDNALQGLIQNRSTLADVLFINITKLGNPISVGGILVILAAVLIVKKHYRSLIFLLITSASSVLANTLIKKLVARPRPVPQLIAEHGYSFPSGHAMISILFYGTLVLIAYRLLSGWLQSLTIGLLSLLIILIPISRIYVNVHYPSDVLAGVFLAFGMLLIIYHFYPLERKDS